MSGTEGVLQATAETLPSDHPQFTIHIHPAIRHYMTSATEKMC
jgi:hypothetical protein